MKITLTTLDNVFKQIPTDVNKIILDFITEPPPTLQQTFNIDFNLTKITPVLKKFYYHEIAPERYYCLLKELDYLSQNQDKYKYKYNKDKDKDKYIFNTDWFYVAFPNLCDSLSDIESDYDNEDSEDSEEDDY